MGRGQDGKKRPVIIKLLSYKDKLYILKNAKHLKGTGYYINEDFSYETMMIRKELWEEVKQRYICYFKIRLYLQEICQIQQAITILKINVLTLLKKTVFF